MDKKVISLSALLLLLPGLAFAAQTPAQWFTGILNNFLNIVVWPIFITIAVGMFVWAGILYLSAHGDPSKVAQANKAVIYGIIGIVVAILGFSIVGFIQTVISPYQGQQQGGDNPGGNQQVAEGACWWGGDQNDCAVVSEAFCAAGVPQGLPGNQQLVIGVYQGDNTECQ